MERWLVEVADANRVFSTTSTGRESSSLESSWSPFSDSSLMRFSRVEGNASSEIECAGGILRAREDEGGIGGRGEEDRDGKGAGLAVRGGVLLQVRLSQ
jgi:hypothetical protein